MDNTHENLLAALLPEIAEEALENLAGQYSDYTYDLWPVVEIKVISVPVTARVTRLRHYNRIEITEVRSDFMIRLATLGLRQ